ncbi:hypothetical protein HOLleu_42096 [Holothuria leucospilota]|uniref:Uncharacterized protein n=1 Tax=Holothuria leucospilota TaxID=206669 RepID=A0A9Q1BBS0_HOLLE|nr:hypothetical protein HOLleu_42096 [Holothuria leucospilota]
MERGYLRSAKKKFKIAKDVVLVDKEDGAEIDEDALVPLIENEPKTAIMVLKKGEKWMSPAAAPLRINNDSDTDVISEEEDVNTSDVNLPSSSSSVPPMKRFRQLEAEQPTTDETAELIRAILQKSASGATVLAEYRNQKCLTEKSRRLLVNLVVANMMEVHGKTLPTASKRKYAIGIVNLFESLKDPHTPTGHDTPCKNDGGPRCKRPLPSSSEDLKSDKDDITTDINWLKHTPEVASDANMVFEKMKSTLSVRRNMVNEETPTANILKGFPQFQITPGLIKQDFRLMFPNEHPKLLERWPSIKQKIIALARKSTDGATAELLATVDRGPCEDLELGNGQQEHRQNNLEDDVEYVDYDDDNVVGDELATSAVVSPQELQKQAAGLICKMSATLQVSQNTLNQLAESMDNIIGEITGCVQAVVDKTFQEHGLEKDSDVYNDIKTHLDTLSNPFQELNSEFKRNKYFSRQGMVDPHEISLDVRMDSRINKVTGIHEQVPVNDTFIYIPIIRTLELLIKHPDVLHFITHNHKSHDNVIKDYCDANQFQQSPIFQEDCNALQLHFL